MPLIIAIAGYSNSGKTTLLEKMIPLFKAGGYSVGVIKHTFHGFSLDQSGKDSQKFTQAGADGAAVIGSGQIGFLGSIDEADPLLLDRLEQTFFPDKDLVLVEGFKKSSKPKIAVLTPGQEETLLAEMVGAVVATVGETDFRTDSPHFQPGEAEKLVRLLEDRFLKDRQRPPIRVIVDGKNIPLNHFVQDILRSGILGLLSPLKGYEEAQQVEIRINIPGKDASL
jgi:molybdopterin-guanine dinucleotide biosynthesis adapter protein